MFPTQSKAKLPQGLSYPIGAEAFTEALAGSPHVEDLSLSFRDAPIWPASAFRRVLDADEPYTILAVAYLPAASPGFRGSKAMVEAGWYGEGWEARIYPVRSGVRHLVNGLLRDVGCPAVVDWLRASKRPGWDAMRRKIELTYHPVDAALVVRSS